MTELYFTIPAVPVAQPRQRHRVVNMGGKWIATNYTPTKDPVNAFKASVRHGLSQIYQGAPLEGPLKVDLCFVMPRPGRLRWKRRPMPRVWHTIKPDADNLTKSLVDSLTGLLWARDEQIAELHVLKLYAAGDEQPHATVTVRRLADSLNVGEVA